MSYMNKKVILTEGFFKSLFRLILSGKAEGYISKLRKRKAIKNSGILNDIEKLNKTTKKLDRLLSDYYGKEYSSKKITLADLLEK